MKDITHERCEGYPDGEFDYDVWSCNHCGAHSLEGLDKIEHHASCNPEDTKKWLDYYSDPEWAESFEDDDL